jgi:hypothetical protein
VEYGFARVKIQPNVVQQQVGGTERNMKRVIGVVALLMGSAILLWMGYNLLIECQKEFTGELLLIGTGCLMVYVGVMWIRDKQAG